MAYDAFISYSHAADGQLAPALQRGLQRLAKPWNRRRALNIFRDETGLSTNPHLWSSVQTALDDSDWFILLASPEAAASAWVNKEIERWRATKTADQILPVVTDGTWSWDAAARDFSLDSTAVPQALRGALRDEPRHLDLRWARSETDLDLRNGRFRDAVADLAAPLHGLPKDELEGEDIRQHRHTRRLARAAMVSLAVLLVAALIGGGLAVANADKARREAVTANARRLAAQAVAAAGSSPDVAMLLALEAQRLRESVESRSALLDVLQRAGGLTRVVTGLKPGTVIGGVAADGSSLALSDPTGRVVLIDSVTRSATQTIQTHQTGPVVVAFAPDGETIATASDDHSVRLWDAASGKAQPPVLRGHGAAVRKVQFSPDGGRLASEDESGYVRVWQVADGRLLGRTQQLITLTDSHLAFSPDGKRLAVAAFPTTVLDIATMKAVFQARPRNVIADLTVAFDPSGTLIAISNPYSNEIEVWDLGTKQLRAPTLVAPKETSRVRRLAFSPDGTRLAGGLNDGRVAVWDVASGTEREVLVGSGGPVTDVRFGGDSSHVLATSTSGMAMWQLDTTPLANRTRLSDKRLDSLAFSPDGRLVAIGDSDGRVTTVDTHSLRTLGEPVQVGSFEALELTRLTWARDGRYLAMTNGGSLYDLDVASRRPRHPPIALPDYAMSVAVSPDSTLVAVGDRLGGVTVVDARRWVISRSSSIHAGRVVSRTAFSPEGDSVVSAGGDGRVVSQSLTGGRGTTEATGHPPMGGLSFSPDGRLLAAGFGDGSVVIVDVRQHRRVGAPLIGNGTVGQVAFSHDQRLLAVMGRGGGVTVWDMATRQRIGELVGASGMLDIAFAPDSQALVGVGLDGLLVRWDLDPLYWARRACELAGRNFTRLEWRQYMGDSAYRKTCAQWPAA